jgi:putative lipoic acid-binding regulatory protein
MPDYKKRKVQLEYPGPWVYKKIAPDADELRRAVAEIICDRDYKISHSRRSKINLKNRTDRHKGFAHF